VLGYHTMASAGINRTARKKPDLESGFVASWPIRGGQLRRRYSVAIVMLNLMRPLPLYPPRDPELGQDVADVHRHGLAGDE